MKNWDSGMEKCIQDERHIGPVRVRNAFPNGKYYHGRAFPKPHSHTLLLFFYAKYIDRNDVTCL